MTRRLMSILAAAGFAALPLATVAGEVWVASASEKIRPDAAPRNVTAARIAAAKNEFEAFQVVVRGPATRVSASATDLTGRGGRIGGARLFREDILNIAAPSSLDGTAGRIPDALVPDVDDVVGEKRNAFPFDVPAGESRVIWVEVHVPSDARPGEYHGAVKVTTAEGEAQVPVQLTVWNFALPSTSSLRSAFSLAYNTVPEGHGLPVSTQELADVRARYGQLGLDHRVSITHVNDDGLGGWDHFDATYGPLLDGTARTTLEGARVTAFKYTGNQLDPAQYRDWAQHFKGKGWFDVLFAYTCDEPELTCRWGDIPARASAAKQGDPAFPTLVTTTIKEADAHGVTRNIDIFVPVVNYVWDKPDGKFAGNHAAEYANLVAEQGKEFWTYQSCMSHGCGNTVDFASPTLEDQYYTGWPSYMVDVSSVRNRSMQWLEFQLGVSGEVYFETTEAYVASQGKAATPWASVDRYTGHGDGTLFYPGTPSKIGGSTHIPVASVRLKMVREGMEDYEYLKLLADLGDAEGAREIAARLFPTTWQADASAADLMAAREALANRILELKGERVSQEPVSMLDDQVGAAGGKFDVPGGGMSGGGGCGASGGRSTGLGALLIALAGFAVVRGSRRRARVYTVVRVLPAKK